MYGVRRFGDTNSRWKGDEAGVDALHKWLRRQKPKSDLCEICKLVPPRDLAFLLHPQKYTRNPDDYRWLCHRTLQEMWIHYCGVSPDRMPKFSS